MYIKDSRNKGVQTKISINYINVIESLVRRSTYK